MSYTKLIMLNPSLMLWLMLWLKLCSSDSSSYARAMAQICSGYGSNFARSMLKLRSANAQAMHKLWLDILLVTHEW
ncbi:unnamed protein product [Acanthoscelides obtectus]|uniref:Secreted protein n=1 Tax=Acanthoscelides obtectus TaxID=200917 RepID=A0A9P0VPZ8_ACAOB|nr:unnamed protein product [Acanthoscelides obtectus]CAK1658742.1 hypothetical protein AOBTE_LOCUS21098 [Acanthoscelides obtectus]